MSLNLLKYFISRDEDLPASYVRKCEKFLKEKSCKPQASSCKRLETDTIKKNRGHLG